MVFDGTDDYLDVTPWQFGGSITVEAFVKYASIPASEWLRIMCFSDSDGTDRVELTNQDGTGMARIVVRTGGTYYAHSSTSSSVFEVDKWVHIVVTVEGTTAKIYVNGVLESTGSNVPEPGTATRDYHYIGGRVDTADSYFDGTIAYLRLWHGTALTGNEASELYSEHVAGCVTWMDFGANGNINSEADLTTHGWTYHDSEPSSECRQHLVLKRV